MREVVRFAATGAILLLSLFSFSRVLADEPDYSVLLIGNSHSSRGNLPAALQQLLEEGRDGSSARVVALGHWAFLADRLADGVTQEALGSQPWTHVVLQAQKYSMSGRYTYPTAAAEEWIRRVRTVGATPVLFPEWARKGHPEEGARVQALHEAIAAREPACVAPIGLAWDSLRETNPKIALHDRDDNHANSTGALLTAYVLYAAITGNSIGDLPKHNIRGVSGSHQILLQRAAEKAVTESPPCKLLASEQTTWGQDQPPESSDGRIAIRTD
jgi:hypothetical protein